MNGRENMTPYTQRPTQLIITGSPAERYNIELQAVAWKPFAVFRVCAHSAYLNNKFKKRKKIFFFFFSKRIKRLSPIFWKYELCSHLKKT